MHPELDPPTTPLSIPAPLRASTSTLGRTRQDAAPEIPTQSTGERSAGPPTEPRREPPTSAVPIQQGLRRAPRSDERIATSADPDDAGPAPVATERAVKVPRPRSAAGSPSQPTRQVAARERAGRLESPRARFVLVPLLVGALVAIALGAYGRLHHPSGSAISIAGFSTLSYAKAWLATLAALFGVIQLFTGMTLNGRLLASPPRWAAGLHRWSGRIAVLVSVPVAVACLYALGFQSASTRVWLHSLLGCLFYGAFTAKMLSLSRPGTPRWAVPLLGGVVFTGLIGVWLTSAVWLFSRQGLHL